MVAPTQSIAPELLRWIPLIPLLTCLLNTFFGARLGKRGSGLLASFAVSASFAIALYIFWLLPASGVIRDTVYTWIESGSFQVKVSFQVDALTAVMLLVVTGVGFLIHIYSLGYMGHDEGMVRFFIYLNLFIFFMLLLVMADNLLLLFVGWEGVGLCSYLLIGFWYHDHTNTIAGNKAFIVNRIGDYGFVLGILLLVTELGRQGIWTVDFAELQKHVQLLNPNMITWITLLLFVGATGKSAQIPLFVWLPDAMAGPTPVSALIHAATMVTAGVYMIARLNFLFALAPLTLAVVATIGAATAPLAATIPLAQNDIKRVLAYSTVSQLRHMFLAMGVGAYAAGIFHLMTHAFFKACLFLGSGSVIHAMSGEQDMRKMGGLREKLPATSTTFIVATLAIAGIPPLAGFFSKDEILWQVYSSPYGSPTLWAVGVTVAGLSAFYMFRQVFMVFFGPCHADHETAHHLHESPATMTVPLWILMGGSVLAGLLWIPHVFLPFEAWLEPVVGVHVAVAHHAELAVELSLTLFSVLVALAGIGLAYTIYYRRRPDPAVFGRVLGGVPHRILLNKYYVDELYELLFVRGVLLVCRMAAWFDLRVIDGLVNLSATIVRAWAWVSGLFDGYVVDGAVNALADVAQFVGRRVRNLQSGAINAYLYVVLIGVLGGVLLYWSLVSAS